MVQDEFYNNLEKQGLKNWYQWDGPHKGELLLAVQFTKTLAKSKSRDLKNEKFLSVSDYKDIKGMRQFFKVYTSFFNNTATKGHGFPSSIELAIFQKYGLMLDKKVNPEEGFPSKELIPAVEIVLDAQGLEIVPQKEPSIEPALSLFLPNKTQGPLEVEVLSPSEDKVLLSAKEKEIIVKGAEASISLEQDRLDRLAKHEKRQLDKDNRVSRPLKPAFTYNKFRTVMRYLDSSDFLEGPAFFEKSEFKEKSLYMQERYPNPKEKKIRKPRSTFAIARHKIGFTLLFFFGFRISNLFQFKVRDLQELVKTNQNTIRIIKKGPNRSEKILTDLGSDWLSGFSKEVALLTASSKKSDPLFRNQRFGTELHRCTLLREMNAILKYCPYFENFGLTSHCFRVNNITAIVKTSGLEAARVLADHKSISTTMLYNRNELSQKQHIKINQSLDTLYSSDSSDF